LTAHAIGTARSVEDNDSTLSENSEDNSGRDSDWDIKKYMKGRSTRSSESDSDMLSDDEPHVTDDIVDNSVDEESEEMPSYSGLLSRKSPIKQHGLSEKMAAMRNSKDAYKKVKKSKTVVEIASPSDASLQRVQTDTTEVGRNNSSSLEQVQEFVSSGQSAQEITEASHQEHVQPTNRKAASLCEFMFCVILFRLLLS
jgi:ABC-type Na+ efflux pump permease subunit